MSKIVPPGNESVVIDLLSIIWSETISDSRSTPTILILSLVVKSIKSPPIVTSAVGGNRLLSICVLINSLISEFATLINICLNVLKFSFGSVKLICSKGLIWAVLVSIKLSGDSPKLSRLEVNPLATSSSVSEWYLAGAKSFTIHWAYWSFFKLETRKNAEPMYSGFKISEESGVQLSETTIPFSKSGCDFAFTLKP